MKKLLTIVLFSILTFACYQKDTTTEKIKEAEQTIDKNTVFSFEKNNLQEGCLSSSDLICTINTTVKCILDPKFAECETKSDTFPAFVLMQDDSLQRPTFQTYKINKLTPREDGAVEVHTQSSCNGSWFGLCSGNIVYVMKNINSKWKIIDIYALEF